MILSLTFTPTPTTDQQRPTLKYYRIAGVVIIGFYATQIVLAVNSPSLQHHNKRGSRIMISLRLKNYKAQDIITLYEILDNARKEFWNERCTKDCQNCKYRTPCTDIALAMLYLMTAKPGR